MTTAILEELAANPKLAYRYTVDDYHRMIATGTLEEGAPFELLDGQVVRKIRNATGEDAMTVDTGHARAVRALADLNREIVAMGCFIQTQQPITLPPESEPEPDAAIVLGDLDDYSDRHPGAADILCVIEVADASLQRDRGYKRELYAANGIPMYVIIDLVAGVAHVYTQPVKAKRRYERTQTLSPRQTLAFPTPKGKGLGVLVRKLLPPR